MITENVLLALSLSDVKLDEDSSEDTGGRKECEVRVVCGGHDKVLTVQRKFIMHSTHKLIPSVMREEKGEKANYRKGGPDLTSSMSGTST